MKCVWHNCTQLVPLHKRSDSIFCSQKCKNKYYVDKRRRDLKKQAVHYLGGKCIRCGYNKCMAALEFHHRDPSQKDFNISSEGNTRGWFFIREELDKCDLLCANCHREVEYEIFKESRV